MLELRLGDDVLGAGEGQRGAAGLHAVALAHHDALAVLDALGDRPGSDLTVCLYDKGIDYRRAMCPPREGVRSWPVSS